MSPKPAAPGPCDGLRRTLPITPKHDVHTFATHMRTLPTDAAHLAFRWTSRRGASRCLRCDGTSCPGAVDGAGRAKEGHTTETARLGGRSRGREDAAIRGGGPRARSARMERQIQPFLMLIAITIGGRLPAASLHDRRLATDPTH